MSVAAAVLFSVAACGESSSDGASAGQEGPVLGEGDVAVIEGAPDGSISRDELSAELERDPELADLEPGQAEYAAAAESILDELILVRWFEGEAAELDIGVSEAEVQEQLAQVIRLQLEGQSGYERFLERQGFTDAEVRERIRLQLLSQKVQEELVPADPDPDAPPFGPNAAERDREAEAATDDFFDKWRPRTVCSEDLLVSRCSNAPQSEQQPPGPAPTQ